MNIFDFGSYLRDLLLNDEDIAEKVGTKIFPLIAPEKTTFPFIIYQRSSTYGDYNKDFLTNYIINIDLVVFSTKYADTIEIAELINDCIQKNWTRTRTKPHLVGSTENFDYDTYYTILSYEIKI